MDPARSRPEQNLGQGTLAICLYRSLLPTPCLLITVCARMHAYVTHAECLSHIRIYIYIYIYIYVYLHFLHFHIHTYIHTYRQTDRQTDRQTQTDRHRQTDTDRHRQTDTDRHRQTQTDTDRHRQTDRQRQTYIHTESTSTLQRRCVSTSGVGTLQSCSGFRLWLVHIPRTAKKNDNVTSML